jgi:hypothetical protein
VVSGLPRHPEPALRARPGVGARDPRRPVIRELVRSPVRGRRREATGRQHGSRRMGVVLPRGAHAVELARADAVARTIRWARSPRPDSSIARRLLVEAALRIYSPATAAFSVDLSPELERVLTPSVSTPSATDAPPALELSPVEHRHPPGAGPRAARSSAQSTLTRPRNKLAKPPASSWSARARRSLRRPARRCGG